jgi:HEAT repeat protein
VTHVALEGLDGVPWGALQHAYGEARDVPDLLRALATEPEDRAETWRALRSNLIHQGTVYEATSRAVPFLIRLAESPDVAARDEILQYVVELAGGHGSMPEELAPAGDALARAEADRSVADVRAVQQAVADGAPAYLRLATDVDSDVRAQAAHALGRCRSRAAEVLPQLRALVAGESDARVAASLVCALAIVGGADEAARLRLEDDSSVVRFAGAFALLRVAGPAAPNRCVTTVVAALDGKDDDLSTFEDVPYSSGTLAADACLALCGLGSALSGDALRRVCEALPTIDDEGAACSLGVALLTHVFEPPAAGLWATLASRPAPRRLEELDAPRLQVLRGVAEARAGWMPYEMRFTLTALGLPGDRGALRAFLGLAPDHEGNPLERLMSLQSHLRALMAAQDGEEVSGIANNLRAMGIDVPGLGVEDGQEDDNEDRDVQDDEKGL